MAKAEDYTFAAGWTGTVYLTKRTKTKRNGMSVMSVDRRPLEDNEIFYIFENYLRRFCDLHNTDTLNVTNEDGEVIFSATLKKTEDE